MGRLLGHSWRGALQGSSRTQSRREEASGLLLKTLLGVGAVLVQQDPLVPLHGRFKLCVNWSSTMGMETAGPVVSQND